MPDKALQIETVKKLYIAATKENMKYERLKFISRCAPKKVYSKRRNGVKKVVRKFSQKSKHDGFNDALIQQHVKVRNANEKFRVAAAKLPDMEAVILMNELHKTVVRL